MRDRHGMRAAPDAQSAGRQIDAILKSQKDWRGRKLAALRSLIRKSDPGILEEVKWKMPSKPLGSPVWSHAGIVCIADILRNAVRLTFPRGASMKDTHTLFNTRLDSKTVRAIDFTEDHEVNAAAFKALILEAVKLNLAKARGR